MSPIQAKLVFLHAAHDFAVTPSAVNYRTLETAMRIHQDAMYPSVQHSILAQAENAAFRISPPPVSPQEVERLSGQLRAIAIQRLEAERIAGI